VFEEDIAIIDHSLTHGEYKKALEQIEELEKKKLSNRQKDILILKKSQASLAYGDHNLALELIDDVLPKFLKKNMPKYYLEALTQKIRIQIEKSQLNEALVLVKQKEVILDSLPSEKLEGLHQERFRLIHMEGIVNFHLKKIKKAAKFAKEGLELAEHYDYKFGIGLALLFLGDCHSRLGQSPKALDFREESLKVFTELDNQYWIAFVQHSIGLSYSSKGDYDKAIECFLQIMPFVDKTENAYQKITILYHLSYTYEANLEPDIAFDYTLQAYQLLNKTDRLDMKRIILKKIVRMSVDRGEIKKADEYFEELKPIIQQLNNSNFDLEIRVFELRKLKRKYFETHSNLLLEEVESKLRELINDETVEYRWKNWFKMELCSILLDVYLRTGDNYIIDEIESLTTELLGLMSKYDSEIRRIALLTQRLFALWIQAKIMGKEKKIEEIRLLLSKTEEYAGVKGNKLLWKHIKKEQEYYSSLIEEFDVFVKSFTTTE